MGEFGFRWLLIDIMSLKLFIGLNISQGQLINALIAPITDAPTINFLWLWLWCIANCDRMISDRVASIYCDQLCEWRRSGVFT